MAAIKNHEGPASPGAGVQPVAASGFFARQLLVWACLAVNVPVALAQLPSYTGGAYGNAAFAHDGRYRWAVGVQNVQVVRSAPDNPSQTDGESFIYRHHQFIAYWGGRFWVMHDGDTAARLAWSTNGLDWSPSDSSTIFPAQHHRMAFYVVSGRKRVFLGMGVDAGLLKRA